MGKSIIIAIFALITTILLINLLKFISNFFSNRKKYTQVYDVRAEVNRKIRPRLGSLEQKFEREENSGDKFGEYVYALFKDEFKDKNENEEIQGEKEDEIERVENSGKSGILKPGDKIKIE